MSPMALVMLAGAFQGLCNFTFKLMANTSSSIFTIAGFFVLSGLMLTGYGLVVKDGVVSSTAWSWALLAAVLITIADVLLFRGLGAGAPAGIGFVMFAVISMGIVMLLGMLVLGEKINLYGWAGLAFAAVAIVLMANGKMQ